MEPSVNVVVGSPITLPGSLSAQDFGAVNYDSGLGILNGYTAGFGLTDATFANVQSVVVQLYSSSTLLQTNTATAKVGTDITGAQISSPFDVFGNFNYVTDGYWTNVRGTEYGQNMVPTKVVATVILENGKTVTAENDTLTGTPITISNITAVTNPAADISATDATLNGTDGAVDASGHSFWVSTSTYSTVSPTIPDGVYSTLDLGPITANTAFSAPLSSATNIPTITPNTTYYFNAWSKVGSTWYPGEILNFTTASTTEE